MALFARANANASLLTNNCYFAKLTSHDVMLRTIANYANKLSSCRKSSKWTCFLNPYDRNNITSSPQQNFIRNSHVEPHNKNYVPFGELLDRRRQEASRSILVQVQSPSSHNELFAYCKQFGKVDSMHHYTVKNETHFFLVEFDEKSSVNAALEAATHVKYDEVVPVQSPMLWFRNNRATKANGKDKENLNGVMISLNGSGIPKNEEVVEKLVAAKTISEQMLQLHGVWQLDEVGVRMRFLTAHQLERSFIGFFPHIAVLPFGSSVNGFGKRGCDLDLVLQLEQEPLEKSSSRFVFHSKSISNDNRIQSKKLMETVADTMQYLIPGVTNVRRILQARVPIIKYDQTLTGLECDLSMTNSAAIYMTELLCFYGEVDFRVRPLVFTIRQWAYHVGLTNPTPGRWITNFSITLLVLFYLQQKRILPSLAELKRLAGSSDVRLTDHSVDCTFLRDVRKLPVEEENNKNTDNLETLLLGFFNFYSSFDFPAKAISLRDGTSLYKPDYSPLYICNPLETMLNVSKNVSVEETERLKLALRNASWILETSGDDKTFNRGILSLFGQQLDIVSYVGGKRTVNVAALFKIPSDKKKSAKNQNKTPETVIPVHHEDPDRQSDRTVKMKTGRARRR